MSATLVSSSAAFFGDFGDHYPSNGSTTLQNSSKNSFGSQLVDKKSTLQSVFNSVQNNNNININNTNNANVINRRLVTTTTSVPINLSHSSQRLQSSTTVPLMHQKSVTIGVTNTQTPITLIRGMSQCSPTNNNNNNTINAMNNNNINNNKEHKKLDRSYSEPADKQSQQQLVRLNSASATVAGPMSSRYKTELCRSFGEVGTCKYGDKCQFAHGGHELRIISRHPKFKTENCKSFHSTGFCPYGPRCHFIHNTEETKKSMLTNLSTTNGNNNVNTNGLNNNHNSGQHSQNRMAEQLMNNLNNNSHATIGFGSTYHSSNQSSHPLRPKALSIGSYSLGSSGEISPPSSQSGSPTSLNSFFTEDPFNPFVSPTNQSLGSCANNAFSFSPDFSVASLVPTNKGFGGSQPTLSPPFGLTANMNADISNESAVLMPNLFSNQFQTSNINYDEHLNDGIQNMSTTPPSPPSKMTSMPYPMAPQSPVDSISSDVEALKLDNSPTSSSSPIDVAKGVPRLPIFARFSSNGNNDSD